MMHDKDSTTFDCSRAMEQLFEMLDGELTGDRERRLREHINSCPHCFSHADFEQRFLAAVHAAKERGGCPGALRARVIEALKAEGLQGLA